MATFNIWRERIIWLLMQHTMVMSLNAEHWSGHELLCELEPLQAHAHIFINEGDHLGSAGLIPSLNIINCYTF